MVTKQQGKTNNTVINPPEGGRPVQKQYTQGPVTKQDVRAVNQEPQTSGIEHLKNKLADQDYVSQAIKDAEYNDEDNNKEDIENNG